jgi:probable HAF family extracellular repeat protein
MDIGLGGAFTVALSASGNTAGTGLDRRLQSVAWFDETGSAQSLRTNALAADVNSSGMVVGTTITSSGTRATVWRNGEAEYLGPPDGYATAVNDSGVVAGGGRHGRRGSAFVHQGGKTIWIDAGEWSAAQDINSSGQVAGYLEDKNRFRAFLWTAGAGVRTLGTLGGRNSYANGVNDAGIAVGASNTASGALHAAMFGADRVIDLGTLGGRKSGAYGINNLNQVVGYSYDAQNRSRAFLWDNNRLIDLNSLIDPLAGWTLAEAYGINDRGQIAGIGTYDGDWRAFLLTPQSSLSKMGNAATAAVPEPGTMVLAFAGLAGGALVRLRYVRPY